MKLLKLLPALALATGVSIAFAGTPKIEPKANEPTTTVNETKARDAEMYWFNTTSDGTDLLDHSGIPLSQGTDEVGPCDGNASEYCARGFLPSETSISGGKRVPNIPVSSGAPDKKQ